VEKNFRFGQVASVALYIYIYEWESLKAFGIVLHRSASDQSTEEQEVFEGKATCHLQSSTEAVLENLLLE
jgi:hypothetical protein